MTRKPNIWKCILGVVVLALMFIGTWATTRAPRANAAKNGTLAVKASKATVRSTSRTAPFSAATDSIERVFEITDGNVEDDATSAQEDWNNINPPAFGVTPPGAQQQVTGPAGNAIIRTFVNDDSDATHPDQIFTTGSSKDFIDINTAAQAGPTPAATPEWQHTTGSVPDKDEIDQGYAAKYIDPVSGDSILVFGATRFAVNGDSNIGFWFFQNSVGVAANGNFTGFHKNGDLFLLSAFTKGGGTPGIRILVWEGSDPANPGQLDTLANRTARCNAFDNDADHTNPGSPFLDPSGDTLCDITGVQPPGEAFVNSANTTAFWPYTTKAKSCGTNCIPIGAHYEGGINLTALGLQTECFSAFMLETRSSQSVDAVLKDFALGSFNTCVDTSCTKVGAPSDVCEDPANPGKGLPVNYTYTFTNTGAVPVTVSGTDDKLGTIVTNDTVAAGQTKTYNKNNVVLDLGTTTNTATFTATSPFGSDTCSASATVTVHANPVVNPTADTPCVGGTLHLSTPDAGTGATYSWTGPNSFTSNVRQPSISNVTQLNAGTYSVTVTLPYVNGTLSCSITKTVLVTINNLPTCPGGSAAICKLDADGNANTTSFNGPPGMSTYSWSFGGNVISTNQSTGSISAAGTYTLTVTDGNGCAKSCDYILTVQDNPTVAIRKSNLTDACEIDVGPSTGFVLEATAGMASYSWTRVGGGAGIVGATNTSSIIVNQPGTYRVDVTQGAQSCPAHAIVHIGLCCSDCAP